MSLKVPTIHLNGTSEAELLEQHQLAAAAVRDAIKAVEAASPNASDYYVQGPGAYEEALSQHRHRRTRLVLIRAEIESIVAEIFIQQEERAQSRAGGAT